MSTILVVGASGTVGTILVPLLQQSGHYVRRATGRPATEDGQVHLNLSTNDGFDTALAGVDSVYLLSPAGLTRQDELLIPFIDAARRQAIGKLVLMSAMGADADESAPLRRAERHLEASGLRYNIIRPNWFMQNFQSYWIQPILEQGKLLLPTGSGRGSFIDARDIAAVAATLLTSSDHDNQAFDLTGGEAFDHEQVAAILSDASGRTISYVDVSPEAMRAQLLQSGLPADYAEFMLLILGYFKLGYAERITDAVQSVTGRAPRTLAQYAQDHRHLWMR